MIMFSIARSPAIGGSIIARSKLLVIYIYISVVKCI